MKNVVLLGSTGSIGTSTIKVVSDLPDHLRLVGLAAGNNASLLAQQARLHRPLAISLRDPVLARELQPTLDPAICVICQKAMARDATQRTHPTPC